MKSTNVILLVGWFVAIILWFTPLSGYYGSITLLFTGIAAMMNEKGNLFTKYTSYMIVQINTHDISESFNTQYITLNNEGDITFVDDKGKERTFPAWAVSSITEAIK